ncbi:MAG: Crp/Fnr family transcriptional regulator [Flavobacteriaceae bacterium]|jgi:CRP-like cAMP-binding protein|nr:Crp/Fnr family transcriptional regulator [Flavobacteriaceae bacterium]
MYKSLLQLYQKDLTISQKDELLCLKYFEAIKISKNTILEDENTIPKYLYFVVDGFVRLYHTNSKGEEVTTHINCPPGFITSYFHFINRTKSNDTLACITDCQLLRISKTNLDTLNQESQSFKDFSIQVFQQSLAYNEKRSQELATLTAEERYIKLIEKQPEVLQFVPIQYIASFLGMNPKSLSRIRKQLSK